MAISKTLLRFLGATREAALAQVKHGLTLRAFTLRPHPPLPLQAT